MEPGSPLTRLIRDGEHLVRVAALFFAGVLLFLIVRQWLVPAGFGSLGHYRPGTLDDIRQRPLVHAGRDACAGCHGAVMEERRGSRHERIGCETCHGPLAAHAADPKRKVARPDGRDLCLRCHATLVGRPALVPQVEAKNHAPEGACIDCHSPHQPGLGGEKTR